MKKQPKYPEFGRRFVTLFQEGETQEEFGARVGIGRNTIAQYCRGGSMPDSQLLIQICERCHVSADWLLGLSEIKTQNEDIKSIGQYTGLSEESIEVLHDIHSKSDVNGELWAAGYSRKKESINYMLSSRNGIRLINRIYDYIILNYTEILDFLIHKLDEHGNLKDFKLLDNSLKTDEAYQRLIEHLCRNSDITDDSLKLILESAVFNYLNPEYIEKTFLLEIVTSISDWHERVKEAREE